MLKYILITSVCLPVLYFTGCNSNEEGENMKAEQSDTTSNPLMAESTLPFQAPDFDAIENEHFRPAFEAGIRQKLAEIDSIANNEEPPTFENTLEALEKSGRLLDRTSGVFFLLAGANTDSVLQKLQEEVAPKLASVEDAIYLNPELFNRVQSLYEQRNDLNLGPEAMRLLEYQHGEFIRAGANLPAEDKEKLKKLNEEEASLSAKFSNQLLAASKAAAPVFESEDSLAGLPEARLKKAAKNAEEADKEGQWLLPLQNTTQQPILNSLENRDAREKIFNASWTRAEQGGENDTRATLERLAEIRSEKAELLGFDNYAAWKLQDQMAETPEAVRRFLEQLIGPATAKARKEAEDLQAEIRDDGKDFDLQPYDWNFYAEKLRKKRYDLDEEEVKAYFELFNVLENGVFFAANKLYGLHFEQRDDIPVYRDDMRVYEVIDADSTTLGLFYCDYFKRDNKSGGAWMGNFVGQSKLLGTRPVIYNVCNFTKPASGEPALISYDEVTTLFHEFGHALHGFFADQKYPTLSGTNVARDFVEFPSQFNEHWALQSDVLRNYAVHHETGEPMSQELVDNIKRAAQFNQGYALTELLAAANLDMEWHTIGEDKNIESTMDFEEQALSRSNLDLPQVPPRYRSSYFSHIWGGGYAAGYYAYLWSEMLDADAYAWFEQNGGMTRENGQRFREMILSRGNTRNLNEMFEEFRGRDPQIEPMLNNRGLM